MIASENQVKTVVLLGVARWLSTHPSTARRALRRRAMAEGTVTQQPWQPRLASDER